MLTRVLGVRDPRSLTGEAAGQREKRTGLVAGGLRGAEAAGEWSGTAHDVRPARCPRLELPPAADGAQSGGGDLARLFRRAIKRVRANCPLLPGCPPFSGCLPAAEECISARPAVHSASVRAVAGAGAASHLRGHLRSAGRAGRS